MQMAFDATPDQSDDALIARFADGDQAAARLLASRLTPGVLALAWRMLHDQAEAEDVAQDAMMRLWKIAPNWEAGRAKPSTWLYRVTCNLCTDRLRKRRTKGLDEIDEPKDDRPSVEEALIADDRAAALNSAMAQLPERQRTALHLRHFDGCSNGEIADIMDTSVEAIESLTGRAKRALAAILLPEQEKLGLGT